MFYIRVVICAVAFLFDSYAVCATRSDSLTLPIEMLRTKQADQELTRFFSEQKELGRDQYFLFSFTRSVAQNDLLLLLGHDGITVTAVHVCDKAGGITAFFLGPEGSVSDQLDSIRRETRLSANSAIINLPSTRPDSRRLPREDMLIQEDYRFCGVEVKTSLAQMVALKSRMSGAVKAVEITHSRYRKLPMHVVD